MTGRRPSDRSAALSHTARAARGHMAAGLRRMTESSRRSDGPSDRQVIPFVWDPSSIRSITGSLGRCPGGPRRGFPGGAEVPRSDSRSIFLAARRLSHRSWGLGPSQSTVSRPYRLIAAGFTRARGDRQSRQAYCGALVSVAICQPVLTGPSSLRLTARACRAERFFFSDISTRMASRADQSPGSA